MYDRDDQAQVPSLLLTYEQAGGHLGVSEREIRRMVASDQLPVVPIGRLRRIAYEDLRAWVRRARRFNSYFVTPDTLRLVRRHTDEQRLADEFRWDTADRAAQGG